MTTIFIERLPDRELLKRLACVADNERHLTADVLALLGECDVRRLYLGEGCSSLFTSCMQVLHFSEHAAYHRIEAARAARQFPIILDRVADGSVTLTTVALLRPHLTPDTHHELLNAARHRTKREVEYQIACLAPKPTVTPLAADRYLLRVTLSAEPHATLRRAQQLMAHRVPHGDPHVIIGRALSLLVEHLERTKFARVRRPRAGSTGTSPASSTSSPCHTTSPSHTSTDSSATASPATSVSPAASVSPNRSAFPTTSVSASTGGARHIPAAMRRHVWARDEGRCAFVGARGRCTETWRLEFHHVVPFARGGPTSVRNLELRCRAHNVYESDQAFGGHAHHSNGHTAGAGHLNEMPP